MRKGFQDKLGERGNENWLEIVSERIVEQFIEIYCVKKFVSPKKKLTYKLSTLFWPMNRCDGNGVRMIYKKRRREEKRQQKTIVHYYCSRKIAPAGIRILLCEFVQEYSMRRFSSSGRERVSLFFSLIVSLSWDAIETFIVSKVT